MLWMPIVGVMGFLGGLVMAYYDVQYWLDA
jgi:hypothetical protein